MISQFLFYPSCTLYDKLDFLADSALFVSCRTFVRPLVALRSVMYREFLADMQVTAAANLGPRHPRRGHAYHAAEQRHVLCLVDPLPSGSVVNDLRRSCEVRKRMNTETNAPARLLDYSDRFGPIALELQLALSGHSTCTHLWSRGRHPRGVPSRGRCSQDMNNGPR